MRWMRCDLRWGHVRRHHQYIGSISLAVTRWRGNHVWGNPRVMIITFKSIWNMTDLLS